MRAVRGQDGLRVVCCGTGPLPRVRARAPPVQHLLRDRYKRGLHVFQGGQRHHGRFCAPEEGKGGGGAGGDGGWPTNRAKIAQRQGGEKYRKGQNKTTVAKKQHPSTVKLKYLVYSGRVWGGGSWRTHFLLDNSHEFIGDASLSRRSTGPTEKRITSNGRTSVRVCHISLRNLASFASFLFGIIFGYVVAIYILSN